MKAVETPFEYKGYGCPNTEMWSLRHKFEAAHTTLDLSMKLDAPHYNNKATRVAYAEWEKTQHEN